jgi:hypothetical protein
LFFRVRLPLVKVLKGKKMQTLVNTNAAVGIYSTHDQAENAVKALADGGFDMKKLSVVGADYQSEEHVIGYYSTGTRMKMWGGRGAFWGSIWGLILGSAVFTIPGIGPMVVAGPLIAAIVSALEGGVIVGGISALGAGLIGLGIPRHSVLQYETELKAGKFLVVAHGSADDTKRAKNILAQAGLAHPNMHEPQQTA